MFDIPFELFLGYIVLSLTFLAIGLIARNQRLGALVIVSGVMIFPMISLTDTIQFGEAVPVEETSIIHDKVAPYNVTSNTGSGSSFNNSNEARTIEATSTSTLVNEPIQCIQLWLRKVGTPPNIPVSFGTFDSSGNLVLSFGNITIAELGTSFQTHTRCLANNETYFIQANDRIGYRWIDPVGSDGSNNIETRVDVNNPFDGTATRQARFSTSWTSDTGIDLQGSLYRNEDSLIKTITYENSQSDDFEFSEFPKILFGLYSSVLIFIGALIMRGQT